MSITVIKEGSILRVLESTTPVPDGERLVLYTAEEIAKRQPSAWDAAQLNSAFQDAEDWGDSLDALVRTPSAK